MSVITVAPPPIAAAPAPEPPPALHLRIYAADRLVAHGTVGTYGIAVHEVRKAQRAHTTRLKGFVRAGTLLTDGTFVVDPAETVVCITEFRR